MSLGTRSPMRSKAFAIWCVLCIPLLTAGSQSTSHALQNGLIWSDEFSGKAGTAPAAADWNMESGWGPKDNHEIQWYCSDSSNEGPCDRAHPNAFQDGDGHLVLRAIHNGQRWSSARLNTASKHHLLYGRVEARLRIGPGAGFWPAFWLLGDREGKGNWPECGELDIMEGVEKYDTRMTSSAAHGPGYSGAHAFSRRAPLETGSLDDGAFHIYGVTWRPQRVEFYRDRADAPFFVLTPANLPPGARWVFDHSFHIILNLAVSESGFGGSVSPATPRVGSMWVDYVRVYRN